MLLQALQQRQIPSLPGPYMQPAAAPQHNALALLGLILANPNLQRSLQSARVAGTTPRTVQLPVPATTAPGQTRSVSIPMGAVINAIAALAGQSMTELNESTPEDDPEMPSYLVGDDGDYLVDPASSTDRAALVAHLFRLNDEAQRAGYGVDGEDEAAGDTEANDREGDEESDGSEAWAEDAGFI